MSLGLQSLAATQAAVLRSLQAPGSKLTARVTLPASNASARRPPLGVVRVTAQGNFNTEVEDKPTLQTDDSGDSSEKPSLTPTPNRERRNRPTIIRAADRRPDDSAPTAERRPRERPDGRPRGRFTIRRAGEAPPPEEQQQGDGGRGGRGSGELRPRPQRQPSFSPGPPGGGGGYGARANTGGGRGRGGGRGGYEVRRNEREGSLDALRRPGGRGGGRGRGRGRGRGYQVQDVGARRSSRAAKKERLAERAEAEKLVAEEIVEVGPEGMSLRDLAYALAVNEAEVIKALFMKGVAVSVTQTLALELVEMVCEEYETEVLRVEESDVSDAAKKTEDFITEEDFDDLTERPPVVTVMGHVDHGKTSLLDAIRKARVAKGEAGGITQAIGAYQVEVEVGGETKKATFLDTPGHEAFSSMRARGAKVTDVAIILVAADDGVKPQTQEAIKHAQAAEVPMVVAINKIDKVGANVERVKQMLAEVGLLPEEWGGETPMVPVSAHTGEGIPDLMEAILLQAEMAELMANPKKKAVGTVIEAYLDKARGPTATVLVQGGTLRMGDVMLVGATYGKVRALLADDGSTLEEAGPSTPVQLLGLNSTPVAGDLIEVCDSESEARSKAEAAADKQRLERLAEQAGGGSKVTLNNINPNWDDDSEPAKLNVILKGDTSGSVEAIKAALGTLPQNKVVLRFLMAQVGDVTVSDIDLADASEGIVFGFNVPISEAVTAHAQRKRVELRTYNVIYDLIDEVTAAMEGLLDKVEVKEAIGEATVRAVFGNGSTKIAGCYVDEGKLAKGATVEVKRGDKKMWSGELTSLRRVKDVVKEVERGLECGVVTTGFNEWKEGDKINAFMIVEKTQTLDGLAGSKPTAEEDGKGDE